MPENSALSCCNTVVAALEEQNTYLPTFRIENPGTLAALLTPDNLAGVKLVELKDEAGRTVTHRAKYWQNPRVEATDGWQDFCSVGSTTAQKFQDYGIQATKSVKLTLDEAEFRHFCGVAADGSVANIAGFQFAAQQIRAKLNQLIKSYSNAMLVQLAANTGSFSGGATSMNVNLLQQDGSVDANGEVAIRRAFENLELPTDGMLAVGSGNLSEYWYKRQYACCSDAGVDVSKVTTPLRYFRDASAQTLLSDPNAFVAWTPGAAVPYFRTWFNPSPFEKLGDYLVKTTIQVPFNVNGISFMLPVDFTAKYIECGSTNEEASPQNGPDSQWVLTWTINGGLATIPTDIEPSGSPFEGVNNILNFVATCGAAAYCS